MLHAIASALNSSPRNLQVGLIAVTTIDASGIQALVRIRAMARIANVPFQLLGPTTFIRRRLEMAGVGDVFDTVD